MIKKYRIKKPIRAVLWNGKNEEELMKFTNNNGVWIDGKIEIGYTSTEGIATGILLEVGDMVFEVENGNHDCMEASKFNELYEEIKCMQ